MTRPTKERVEQAIAGHYGYEHCRVLGKDDDVCVLAAEVVALREELRIAYDQVNYPVAERDMVHCYPHRTRWIRLAYSTGCPACILEKTLARVEALPAKWRGKACGALTNANTFTIVALELEAALKGEP